MSEPVLYRATVPLPPSINEALRPARMPNGSMRLKKTDKASGWGNVALFYLRRIPRPQELRRGLVAVVLRFHVATIASDGGNRLKLLEDALVRAQVLSDDRQIARWQIEKHVAAGEPRVEIEVSQVLDPETFGGFSTRLAEAERKADKRPGTRAGRKVQP